MNRQNNKLCGGWRVSPAGRPRPPPRRRHDERRHLDGDGVFLVGRVRQVHQVDRVPEIKILPLIKSRIRKFLHISSFYENAFENLK